MKESAQKIQQYDWSRIQLNASDLTPNHDTEPVTVSAGEVHELMSAEVGETGQLSSYDLVRLGQSLDAGNENSGKGKVYADLRDDTDAEIDQRTEVRLILRPRNDDWRKELTGWFPLRDLNVDRQDLRIPLSPVTRNGKPAYAKEGRIIALEVRNSATDVTINTTNCDFDFPARAGY